MKPPFCPNPQCQMHFLSSLADPPLWFNRSGYHTSKVAGRVPRFRCSSCGKTFSERTFSIDYYAKKAVPYNEILFRSSAGECLSAIARHLGVRTDVVANRVSRLARNCLAMHARIERETLLFEDIVADGFESFDKSQYFPNNIALVDGKASQHIYSLSYATIRRKGRMTGAQQRKRAELEARYFAPSRGVEKSFAEALESLSLRWNSSLLPSLVLYTDEHRAYPGAVERSGLGKAGELVHRRVSSQLPRTTANELFSVNYVDRELRKDKAEYHRESTCFVRNVANGLERLAIYLAWHNYWKAHRVNPKWPFKPTHAECAGASFGMAMREKARVFEERAFFSREALPQWAGKVWKRLYPTPLKVKPEYLPAYAFG